MVLSHAPSPAAFAGLAGVLGADPAKFRPAYDVDRLEYDRGTFSAAEYWKRLSACVGVGITPEQIARLRQLDLRIWSDINQPMVAWVRRLRGLGVKTALLSNMPSDMMTHVRTFPWLEVFDCLTFSCELRVVKPEAEIYQHCLENLGVGAQDAIFFDDKASNVSGAQKVGIRALQFESIEKLTKKLRQLGMTNGFLPAVRA
jgi:putative hydrolase of the HAD superfamily